MYKSPESPLSNKTKIFTQEKWWNNLFHDKMCIHGLINWTVSNLIYTSRKFKFGKSIKWHLLIWMTSDDTLTLKLKLFWEWTYSSLIQHGFWHLNQFPFSKIQLKKLKILQALTLTWNVFGDVSNLYCRLSFKGFLFNLIMFVSSYSRVLSNILWKNEKNTKNNLSFRFQVW